MRLETHLGWKGLSFMFLLPVMHGGICPPKGSQVLNIPQETQAILQPASHVSVSQPRPERGSLRRLSSFPLPDSPQILCPPHLPG